MRKTNHARQYQIAATCWALSKEIHILTSIPLQMSTLCVWKLKLRGVQTRLEAQVSSSVEEFSLYTDADHIWYLVSKK